MRWRFVIFGLVLASLDGFNSLGSEATKSGKSDGCEVGQLVCGSVCLLVDWCLGQSAGCKVRQLVCGSVLLLVDRWFGRFQSDWTLDE